MTVAWSWAVEAYLGSSWVDISPDVFWQRGLSARRGLTGSDITDRVASPGSFSFTLNNSESNSAGLLGYYSARHANCRSGFGAGMQVRLKLTETLNQVVNGSFDSDASGWSGNNATLASVAGGASGNCLRATSAAGGSNRVSQQLNLPAGTYTLKMKQKNGNSTGVVSVSASAGGWDAINTVVDNASWTALSFSFTVAFANPWINLWITNSAVGSTVFFDDITLETTLSRYVFNGRLTNAPPPVRQFGDRETVVTAVDYMEQFAIRHISRIPVQIGKRTDQILPLVVAGMPYAPLNTSYDVGLDVFPYSLHDEQDEKTYAITVLQKAAQSDFGYIYVRGNLTDGETLVYENRRSRITKALAITFDNDMSGLKVSYGVDSVYNDVHVPVTPAVVDAAATTILATYPQELTLNPGETKLISLRLTDPSGAGQRISGTDYVDPMVADTDFKMGGASGTGGNDLNAALTITYVNKGANTVDLSLANTGSKVGYVSGVKIRGRGIYLYDTQEAVAADAASQLANGVLSVTYEIPYQGAYNNALATAQEIRRRRANPFVDVKGLMYYADSDAAFMALALSADIGDKIRIKESASGVDGYYGINGVTYTITPQRLLQVDYVLEPLSQLQAWILDDPVYSVLDSTTVLVY